MRFLMYVADLSAVQSYTFSLEKCPNNLIKYAKWQIIIGFYILYRIKNCQKHTLRLYLLIVTAQLPQGVYRSPCDSSDVV